MYGVQLVENLLKRQRAFLVLLWRYDAKEHPLLLMVPVHLDVIYIQLVKHVNKRPQYKDPAAFQQDKIDEAKKLPEVTKHLRIYCLPF